MRINEYKTELDGKGHTVLVKEKGYNYQGDQLNNPESIVDMMNTICRMNKKAEEYAYMLAANTKMKILGMFEISHGSVDTSICNPREMYLRALLCGASQIVVIHNHPSGDCLPSDADVAVTRRIREAGNIIGIQMIDHIIIAGDKYYSFKENDT